jgi:glutamate-1-semialdehyde 2,1-aminomutase
MAAGAATLNILRDELVHERLEELGRQLEAAVAPVAAATGACFVRLGSIFWIVSQRKPPRSIEAVDPEGMTRYADLHALMLARGFYLAPSGWEVGFLNGAMTPSDVERLASRLADALRETARG